MISMCSSWCFLTVKPKRSPNQRVLMYSPLQAQICKHGHPMRWYDPSSSSPCCNHGIPRNEFTNSPIENQSLPKSFEYAPTNLRSNGAQMPSGHGKEGYPFLVGSVLGETPLKTRKKGRHWATGGGNPRCFLRKCSQGRLLLLAGRRCRRKVGLGPSLVIHVERQVLSRACVLALASLGPTRRPRKNRRKERDKLD